MGYFNKILNNCNKASLLLLQSKQDKLSIKQIFEIKFHLAFCKCCKNFDIQSNKIDQSLQALFKNSHHQSTTKASNELKQKLNDILDK